MWTPNWRSCKFCVEKPFLWSTLCLYPVLYSCYGVTFFIYKPSLMKPGGFVLFSFWLFATYILSNQDAPELYCHCSQINPSKWSSYYEIFESDPLFDKSHRIISMPNEIISLFCLFTKLSEMFLSNWIFLYSEVDNPCQTCQFFSHLIIVFALLCPLYRHLLFCRRTCSAFSLNFILW